MDHRETIRTSRTFAILADFCVKNGTPLYREVRTKAMIPGHKTPMMAWHLRMWLMYRKMRKLPEMKKATKRLKIRIDTELMGYGLRIVPRDKVK